MSVPHLKLAYATKVLTSCHFKPHFVAVLPHFTPSPLIQYHVSPHQSWSLFLEVLLCNLARLDWGSGNILADAKSMCQLLLSLVVVKWLNVHIRLLGHVSWQWHMHRKYLLPHIIWLFVMCATHILLITDICGQGQFLSLHHRPLVSVYGSKFLIT